MKGRMGTAVVATLFLCGLVGAESVSWIEGMGAPTPSGWSISPSNPSTASVITFKGPTDQSYGNNCVAEKAYGGKPYLSINNSTKTIELKFQGPTPTMCTLILKPAVGFQGDFGPLAAGNWTFKCTNALIAFQLPFTVRSAPGARILRVDRNAPLTIWTPDGSSWTKAYPNLHDGLAAALPGDTLRVADGTYVPDEGSGVTPDDRGASFVIRSDVTVLCGYAGYGAANPDARDVDTYPTILSGDLKSNDLWGIVNTSDNAYHVVSGSESGVLDGAIITAGNANEAGDNGCGGGVFLKGSTLKLNACKILGNKADFGAGVACLEGVAPVLTNTEITGNWAWVFGGCLYNDDANIQLVNCLITGNTAGGADLLGGDAILDSMGSLDIINCTIADNRPGHGAPANGRAIVSLVWGPGVVDTISIKNSILRNGGSEIWCTEPGIVTLYSNNIEGGKDGFAGSGNIDKDPLFKEPGGFGIEGGWFFADDGYMLLAGSPSINAGNQALLPAGLTVDLNGNARVQGSQVDQGAYEGAAVPPLPPAVVLVPNVVGQTQAAATTLITNALLVVGTITQAYSDSVANGRVISQDPAGGSTAEVGSAVNLVISKGPAPGGSWTLNTTHDFRIAIPDPAPGGLVTVYGSGSWTFYTSSPKEYKIEIIGVPALGGTWTITPSGGNVPSGSNTINYSINAVNVDLSSLPPGLQKVATINFYLR